MHKKPSLKFPTMGCVSLVGATKLCALVGALWGGIFMLSVVEAAHPHAQEIAAVVEEACHRSPLLRKEVERIQKIDGDILGALDFFSHNLHPSTDVEEEEVKENSQGPLEKKDLSPPGLKSLAAFLETQKKILQRCEETLSQDFALRSTTRHDSGLLLDKCIMLLQGCTHFMARNGACLDTENFMKKLKQQSEKLRILGREDCLLETRKVEDFFLAMVAMLVAAQGKNRCQDVDVFSHAQDRVGQNLESFLKESPWFFSVPLTEHWKTQEDFKNFFLVTSDGENVLVPCLGYEDLHPYPAFYMGQVMEEPFLTSNHILRFLIYKENSLNAKIESIPCKEFVKATPFSQELCFYMPHEYGVWDPCGLGLYVGSYTKGGDCRVVTLHFNNFSECCAGYGFRVRKLQDRDVIFRRKSPAAAVD